MKSIIGIAIVISSIALMGLAAITVNYSPASIMWNGNGKKKLM